MDEYFHINQTLSFASHGLKASWDPKITTPPGLYFVGLLCAVFFDPELRALRAVNSMATTLLYLQDKFPAYVVHGFPLYFFYTTLYYTDVWSMVLVLLGIAASFHHPFVAPCVLGLSLFFRQTNIVWASFAAGLYLVNNRTVVQCFREWRAIASKWKMVVGYAALVLAFCCFVYENGGVVLGDKSNHRSCFHAAQLLYYILFASFFSFPLSIKWLVRGNLFKKSQLVFAPIELGVIFLIIKHCTIVHPFVLADNRHYTFYIWRRLITPCQGYLMLPVYWVGYRWLRSTMDLRLARTWIYILAVCIVLIPTPLMEPRYYALPYLVWRLIIYHRESTKLENLWYALINIGTVSALCLTDTHFMW